MMNNAAALHALITPAPDDVAVANEHRADRNTAFAEAGARFFNRALQERIDLASVALMLMIAT